MSCLQTIQDYAFRAIGYGERLLPRSDITLCEQFTLIGSGMIWNVYFGVVALFVGFFMATGVALAKSSKRMIIHKPAAWFIFFFAARPYLSSFFWPMKYLCCCQESAGI